VGFLTVYCCHISCGRKDLSNGESLTSRKLWYILNRAFKPAIYIVLQKVSDNVGLLQEETHGVGESLRRIGHGL
jgi:hypothetical protein